MARSLRLKARQRKMLRFLCTFSFLFACSLAHADKSNTAAGTEVQVTGTEQWRIGVAKYHIDGTMLVAIRPNPEFLYVIRVFVAHNPGKQDRTMAKLIAEYAHRNGYFARARERRVNGHRLRLVPKIGVAIVHKSHSIFSSSFHGYKFLFKLSELQ